MEFSHVPYPGLKQVYDLWSFQAIPLIGSLVSNDRQSYQYLVESIRQFPTQENLCEMIRSVAFQDVSYENLSGGIVAIHTGYKLPHS
jgi:ubiquinone/menaquinone biosynthesis C-methylase UbiE